MKGGGVGADKAARGGVISGVYVRGCAELFAGTALALTVTLLTQYDI